LRISKNEVSNTSDERGDVRLSSQGRCSTSELALARLNTSARGLDDGSAVGGVGGGLRGDGRGHVCDRRGGGCAGHGNGVDAVDSRGDVDGGIILLVVLGEGADEERKERDDDLLEGAHGDDGVIVGVKRLFVVMRR
jgi:hypothetical protein